MKKILFWLFIVTIICFTGCKSMPEASDTGEMTMTARVIWASEDSLSVCVLPQSDFGENEDLYSVSTKVSSPEGIPKTNFGDTVEVTFVGPIEETIPPTIPEGKVCSIKVIEKAEIVANEIEQIYIPKPSVMVDGIIYESTGEARAVLRCGTLDGEITSSVDSGLLPTENDQSNFGTGYGYQFWTEGELDVVIDNEWIIFKAAICDGVPTAE